MQTEEQRINLTRSPLPWAVAAGALVIFLVTLNHWVSVASVPFVSRLSGWEWTPQTIAPLTWLVTLPVNLLPASIQPLALNLLNAVLAAVTLGLLVRSVILLPHDRTKEQRRAEHGEHALLSARGAWIPPLLAAAICGLQATFWENATAFTGEMVDLVVFAFCIWSLLEYRLDRRDRRLYLMALVYGLGTANNYALIAFFPAFVVAVAWTMERSILRFGFLAKIILCGLLGLSLYLLLPAIYSGGDSNFTFWQVLKSNLTYQKMFLKKDLAKLVLLRLGVLVPLLSVLLMAVRWPSSFGETSHAGQVITSVMFRIKHAALMGVCVWVAFDPPFSPRSLGLPVTFLSIYYLGALAVGYFAGYFVLLGDAIPRAWARMTGSERLAKAGLLWMIRLTLVVISAALLAKNLPAVRSANSPGLRDLIRLKTAALPSDGAIVLSDHPVLSRLAQTVLRDEGRADKFLLVDTSLLQFPDYQRHLVRRAPGRWPDAVSTNAPPMFDSPGLMRLMAAASQSNAIYYLHPSFGYYFELFYLVPRGAVYRLDSYQPGMVVPPPLSETQLADNGAFWKKLEPSFRSLIDSGSSGNITLAELARDYSRTLNFWAVTLQRHQRLTEAANAFALAERVNPDNVCAKINRQFNTSLQAGKIITVELDKPIQDLFEKYRSWDTALGACGPLDEPALLVKLAQTFGMNSQFRQASGLLTRAVQLDPTNITTRFILCDALLQANFPDAALNAAAEIRARHRPLTALQEAEIVRVEAWSFFRRGDLATAESMLEGATRQYPTLEGPLESLSQMYLLSSRFTNALAVFDRQLKIAPNNLRTLLNKSAVAIQAKAYAEAIPPADLAIQLQPDQPAARLNRAIAHLLLNNLDAADNDYRTLLYLAPRAYAVHYGLGEIAWKRDNRPGALEHYLNYLKFAPTNSDEHATVAARVAQLQAKK